MLLDRGRLRALAALLTGATGLLSASDAGAPSAARAASASAHTRFEAESMHVPKRSGRTARSTAASAGGYLELWGAAARKRIRTKAASDTIVIRARATSCRATPVMAIAIDGRTVRSVRVSARRFAEYTAPASVRPGPHTVSVRVARKLRRSTRCDARIQLDELTLRSAAADGWRLAFADDFDAGRLDASKWMTYSGRTSGGVGFYRPSALAVRDGELTISGRGRDGGGVAHIADQLYGRWEVRARMDRGAGYGPAALLWPRSQRWPIDGEIDIAEQPHGDRRETMFSVHYGVRNHTLRHFERGDFTRWHTFAVEWEPGVIRSFLDGRLTYTLTSPREAVPTTPMHLALQVDTGPNAAIGPRDAATPEVVALHVDWVRVYRR